MISLESVSEGLFQTPKKTIELWSIGKYSNNLIIDISQLFYYFSYPCIKVQNITRENILKETGHQSADLDDMGLFSKLMQLLRKKY